MHPMILCPIWILLGAFPVVSWSWSREGFIDSVLADYSKFDQAARADVVKDGVITESEFTNSLYRQADISSNNDNKVSRDEFIDHYFQRFNISSELSTAMFNLLNDPNSRDEFITSDDVSLSSFSGRNYATVAEFRDGLEKGKLDDDEHRLVASWLRQSADKLYTILMSPHVIATQQEPEIKYSAFINSVDTNNDDVITVEELIEELKRINPSQSVSRRDWVWRNSQRYGADPVTANLVFDYWDRNRDLELSPHDMQELKGIKDLNGNNKIDVDEFLRFVERGYMLSKRMAAQPLPITMIQCPDPWWWSSKDLSPRVEAHRAAMDLDDDLNGWVTLADLRRWVQVFDKDDDASISRREYTDFNSERYGVNSSVATAMFDLSDLNGDDKIDEQDWEFYFKDGFSVSFCDARRSILDLVRMAEQFRGIRQGRELRDSAQRRLQEEWSWHLQNRRHRPPASRLMESLHGQDATNIIPHLCGSRTMCYVGEYMEDLGQPTAWLWWGMKDSARVNEAESPFVEQAGEALRPFGGFPSAVGGASTQMWPFINPGGQMGGASRPIGGVLNPVMGGNSPIFDPSPWIDIASMGPLVGMGPYPRFRRTIANDQDKFQSEKPAQDNRYFSTYHRLFSPFKESGKEPTESPIKPENDFTKQQPLQHQHSQKQSSDSLEAASPDLKNPETPRIRTADSTNGQPTPQPKVGTNENSENQQLPLDWLPFLGYPVVFGLDPLMFGGIPNWGMFGRKKREDMGEGEGRGNEERMRQDTASIDNDDELNVNATWNGTVEKDDFEYWRPMLSPPPGFGMLPWDFWMAWTLENAMWDTMSLFNDVNSSYVINETDSTGARMELGEEDGREPGNDPEVVGDGTYDKDAHERERRSGEGITQIGTDKETVEAGGNAEVRARRFVSTLVGLNSLYWPLILNRWRRQFVPIGARFGPAVNPNFNDYRTWNARKEISSYSNPWSSAMWRHNPWFGPASNWNPWGSVVTNTRVKRDAVDVEKESVDQEGDRELRSNKGEASRRESLQGDSRSSGDAAESVWRSASKKNADKEEWEQEINAGSSRWNLGTNGRSGYTTSRWLNENLPKYAQPTEPGWWRNILSGTGKTWKSVYPGSFGNPWDTTPYGRSHSVGDEDSLRLSQWGNFVPRTRFSSLLTPRPAWSDWGYNFGNGLGIGGEEVSPFESVDQWLEFLLWLDHWQDGFHGNPGSWTAIRDMLRNGNDLDNLWETWYGRFSRETNYTASVEDERETASEGDKQDAGEKADSDSEENVRKRRWVNAFGDEGNSIVSLRSLSRSEFSFLQPFCQNYWRSSRSARSADESGDGGSENSAGSVAGSSDGGKENTVGSVAGSSDGGSENTVGSMAGSSDGGSENTAGSVAGSSDGGREKAAGNLAGSGDGGSEISAGSVAGSGDGGSEKAVGNLAVSGDVGSETAAGNVTWSGDVGSEKAVDLTGSGDGGSKKDAGNIPGSGDGVSEKAAGGLTGFGVRNSEKSARSLTGSADVESEKKTKRSSASETDKKKRWGEWNSDNVDPKTKRMPDLWDAVCPFVLQSGLGYNMQDDQVPPLRNVMYPYQQFRVKREAMTGQGDHGPDFDVGPSKTRRWEQWRDLYADDADCVEWIYAMSAWSPWKGWNQLRLSRESEKLDSNSNKYRAAHTYTSRQEGKDSRDVRCRAWYRKHRDSNDRDGGDASNRGLSKENDSWRNPTTPTEKNDHLVRERRDTPGADKSKRQGQLGYLPSWMFPKMFPNTRNPWRGLTVPQLYQDSLSQFGPEIYLLLSYYDRWNSPFDIVRGRRGSNDSTKEAVQTGEGIESRGAEDSDRKKRFWGHGPGLYGENRWGDNRDVWGGAAENYYRGLPLHSRFADYNVPWFGSFRWMRQERDGPENSSGTSEGKQTLVDDGLGREKRETGQWPEFPRNEDMRSESMQHWMGDRQQSDPHSWNKFSRQNVEADDKDDKPREKRFAMWEDLTLNPWNNWLQQLRHSSGNRSPYQWQSQDNHWRYSRDVSKDLTGRQKREATDSNRFARQHEQSLLYDVPQGYAWDDYWRNGEQTNAWYSNYLGAWSTMNFPLWYTPISLWRPMRFERNSSSDQPDVRVDKSKTESDWLSRSKRWGRDGGISPFSDGWGGVSLNRDVFPWKGGGTYGMFPSPNFWGTSYNQNRFRRGGDDALSSVGRSRRDADEGSKTKRWVEQQGLSQSPWWQQYPFNAKQGMESFNHQRPFSATALYPQGDSYWQGGRPRTESLQQAPWERFYSQNQEPTVFTKSWGKPMFPRDSRVRGGIRTKRGVQSETINKPRQHDEKFVSTTNSPKVSPHRPHSLRTAGLENLWRDNSGYSSKAKQEERDKNIAKRWQGGDHFDWPVFIQWSPLDLFNIWNNQWALRNLWGKGQGSNQVYPREAVDDIRMINKRSSSMWGSDRSWQRAGLSHWAASPQWSTNSLPGRSWMNAPLIFGDQRSGTWGPVRYSRQAEREEPNGRLKIYQENPEMFKKWQENDMQPSTDSRTWSWSPKAHGIESGSWLPKGNWNDEDSGDLSSYTGDTSGDEASGRHRRDIDTDEIAKRWHGDGLYSPGSWLGINPYGSPYSWDGELTRGRQPSWSDRSMWNHVRFPREADEREVNSRKKSEEGMKPKRWIQNGGFPRFVGDSPSWWIPHSQGSSSWSRDWNGRSIFRPPAWTWQDEDNSKRGWARDGSHWRYPRETRDSQVVDKGDQQNIKAEESTRGKRWQGWSTRPVYNWGSLPPGLSYDAPWYSIPPMRTLFNNNKFLKRNTKEESRSNVGDNSLGGDDKERKKRWESWNNFPVSYLDPNMLLDTNPFWFSGSFSGWINPFRSSLMSSFGRETRETYQGDTTDTTEGNSRSKRSSKEDMRGKQWDVGSSFPSVDLDLLVNWVGSLTNNRFPWSPVDQWWPDSRSVYRYRRSSDGKDEKVTENTESDTRNKRQNYWSSSLESDWNTDSLDRRLSYSDFPFTPLIFLYPLFGFSSPNLVFSGSWGRNLNQLPGYRGLLDRNGHQPPGFNGFLGRNLNQSPRHNSFWNKNLNQSPLFNSFWDMNFSQVQNPLFQSLLSEELRGIKRSGSEKVGDEVRQKRETGSEDQKRHRRWLRWDGNPTGYASFGSTGDAYRPAHDFDSSDWFGNHVFVGKNAYPSWGDFGPLDAGVEEGSYGRIRAPRGSNKKDGQERQKRDIWSNGFYNNEFGNGRINDDPLQDERNRVYPWLPGYKQLWYPNRPYIPSQQWRADGLNQWGRRLTSSVYPRYERSPFRTERGGKSDESTRGKRDTADSNYERGKRWWSDNSGRMTPQYGRNLDWQRQPQRQWEQNIWYPHHTNPELGDAKNGIMFRRKREFPHEARLKNKRWGQFDSSTQNRFLQNAWDSPSANLWRSLTGNPMYSDRSFNPLINPGNMDQSFNPLINPRNMDQSFNPLHNQGYKDPSFNPLISPKNMDQSFNLINPRNMDQSFNPLINPRNMDPSFNPLQNPGSMDPKFNPIRNPGIQRWSSFGGQAGPTKRGLASDLSLRRKRRQAGDVDEAKREVYGRWYPWGGSRHQFSGNQYPFGGSQYQNGGSQYPFDGSQYQNSGSQYQNSGSQYQNGRFWYPFDRTKYQNRGNQLLVQPYESAVQRLPNTWNPFTSNPIRFQDMASDGSRNVAWSSILRPPREAADDNTDKSDVK